MPVCSNCIYLSNENWSNEKCIKTVNINNWIKCNSKCIYCTREETYRQKPYNILPVFKDMIKNKLLKNGGYITISGGEPTIAPEFEALINLFIKNNIHTIKVLTNGIKYSKAIEKGLRLGVISILVSTDSGSESMFKKIKRVNKYNQVWNNLNKYAQNALTSDLVKTKYIIIPKINDTKEEVDAFINQNYNNGIKHTEIDIEIDSFYENRENNEYLEKIYDFYTYAKEKAKEKGIYIEQKDRMVILLSILNKEI